MGQDELNIQYLVESMKPIECPVCGCDDYEEVAEG